MRMIQSVCGHRAGARAAMGQPQADGSLLEPCFQVPGACFAPISALRRSGLLTFRLQRRVLEELACVPFAAVNVVGRMLQR
eukprot:327310-Pleurochrysis_carterae.AAC.10